MIHRAHAFIGIIGLLLLTAARLPVRAAPQAPAGTPTTACDLRTEAEFPAILAAAGKLLEQQWLVTEKGYFAAYMEPAEKRSPFDLSKPDPRSGSRPGFVQARKPACHIEQGASGRWRLRYVTPYYRFREKGERWSPPLRDGLMVEVEVTAGANGWTATDVWSPKGILDRDVKPHRPDAVELPPLSPWAAPIPGCGRRERWDGNDCVPRKHWRRRSMENTGHSRHRIR